MRLPLAALALLAGCLHATPYRPPSWDPAPLAVVSVGCLELAARLLASEPDEVPGIPTRISFHSDCKELSLLDLRRVRVSARPRAGDWVALVPYDPQGVLHAGRLAPGDSGSEPIEYDARDGPLPAWSIACVDFDAVRPDVAPVEGAMVCFDRAGRFADPDEPAPSRSLGPDGGAP